MVGGYQCTNKYFVIVLFKRALTWIEESETVKEGGGDGGLGGGMRVREIWSRLKSEIGWGGGGGVVVAGVTAVEVKGGV